MNTIHEQTISNIEKYWRENYNVHMARRGMRKAVWNLYKRILEKHSDEEDYSPEIVRDVFEADFPRPGFNPDLYCAQRIGDTIRVTVIEVEDTSRLTPRKLSELAWCWFYADCSEFIEFHCWACDRFGKSWRKLDLREMWFKWCSQDNLPPVQ